MYVYMYIYTCNIPIQIQKGGGADRAREAVAGHVDVALLRLEGCERAPEPRLPRVARLQVYLAHKKTPTPLRPP